MAILFIKLPPFNPELQNIYPFINIAGIKERLFKTAPHSSIHLIENIYKFYNKPSLEYSIQR